MRVKKRRFKAEGYEHVYCRSANKAILFFDDIDRLAYYTAFSSRARKTGVVVLGLSIMFDHIHHLSAFATADGMSSFMRDHLSFFALEYNEDMGKHGPVFEKAYGNAPKYGDKKIRTAIAYVANNHTEKKLCARVEECRWNFVAYLGSDYPFSERIQLDKASRKMRRSIAAVRSCDGPIGYRRLRNLFDGLNEKEKEQLKEQIADIKANCDLAIEGRDVKIKELEKENAELKDDNKVMADNYSKMEQKFYNNITKAKELLQRFIKWARTENCEKFDVILADAEQFLKADVGTKNYEEQDKILKTKL